MMDDDSLPQCPLCFETFADPRLFSCGHSICYGCVSRMPMVGTNIVCPMCKQTTVCGQNKQLPKNFTLIEMIEKMVQEQSSVSKKASCPHHADQKVDLFCAQCRERVCAKCLLLGPHKGHQHVSEQEFAETEKLGGILKAKKDLLLEIIANYKQQLGECESFSLKIGELQALSANRCTSLAALCTFLEAKLSLFGELTSGSGSIEELQRIQKETDNIAIEVSPQKELLETSHTSIVTTLNKCCTLFRLNPPPAPSPVSSLFLQQGNSSTTLSPNPLPSSFSQPSNNSIAVNHNNNYNNIPNNNHNINNSSNNNSNNNSGNNNNSTHNNSNNSNTSSSRSSSSSNGINNRRGRLYIVGGFNTAALSSVEEYVTERGTWREFAPMRTKRSSVASAVFQGQLYAIGGNDENSNSLATVERYSDRLGRWEEAMAMTSKRSGLSVAVLHDRLYALGGYDGLKVLSSVDGYDPSINRWIHVPAMRQPRNFLAAAVLNDSIFALGGSDGTNRLNTAERYERSTQRWASIAPMVHKRSGLAAAVVNGNIYAIGGFDGTTRLNSVEMYYVSTDKWVEVSCMNARRTWLGATIHDGCIYAVGGFDGANRLTSVERYDPRIDRWDIISEISIPRSGMGVASL